MPRSRLRTATQLMPVTLRLRTSSSDRAKRDPGDTEEMTDSSSPATAFAAHVKLIIANCDQNGAPDEVRFVGAMSAHGSDAHSNQRVTQRPCRPCARANVLYFPFS